MEEKIKHLEDARESLLRERLARNPVIAFLGIQVPALGEGFARFVLPFRPQLANSIGLMQGGVIAALADEAVAYALWSLVPEEESISTVELKINFLAPVREGAVEAVARIVRRGKTISLGEVDVWGHGKLVAKGLFTYIHLQPR